MHLDLPEAPVVIDLPEHEVAGEHSFENLHTFKLATDIDSHLSLALRDKQEADWELEMTR